MVEQFSARRLTMFRYALKIAALPAALLLVPLMQAQAQTQGSRVEGIRFWSFGDVTRIAIDTAGTYELKSDHIENPSRVYFDLNGLQPPSSAHHGMQTIPVGDRRIKQIRVAQVAPGRTRIVLDLMCPVEVISSQLVNPDRLMVEIRPKGTSLPALSAERRTGGSPRVELPPITADPGIDAGAGIDAAAAADLNTSQAAMQIGKPTAAKVLASLENKQAEPSKPQLVIAGGSSVKTAELPPIDAARRTPLNLPGPSAANIAGIAAATNDSSGDRSLVRVLGLKLGRVVIDAGHGGKDTGTIGPNGLTEKELVLDVALRLGRLIKQELGAEVIYTRSDDTFIRLEDRPAIANDQKADLFISVHANSSPEASATGVETYYFNLNSDRKGLDLAMRENASANSSISDLNDLLHRAVLQTKMEESREFAQKVEEALLTNAVKMNSAAHERGVRQAPFVVLIGATMPSILAEIGFVSNPHDEKLMRRPEQREKIAEALLKGVTQYANSLSHTQMARAGSE